MGEKSQHKGDDEPDHALVEAFVRAKQEHHAAAALGITPSELATLRRLRAGELKLVGQEVTPDMINAGTAFVLNNPGIKVADKFRGIFLAMLDAAPPAAKEEGNG